jgi:hypothetical protein
VSVSRRCARCGEPFTPLARRLWFCTDGCQWLATASPEDLAREVERLLTKAVAALSDATVAADLLDRVGWPAGARERAGGLHAAAMAALERVGAVIRGEDLDEELRRLVEGQ